MFKYDEHASLTCYCHYKGSVDGGTRQAHNERMPPSSSEVDPDLVTVPEIAKLLDVSVDTARRLIDAGKVPSTRFGAAARRAVATVRARPTEPDE